MATQSSSRDPWRVIWRVTTSDEMLVALLLSVAAGLLLAAWLPQEPSVSPGAYARWLSETQARFGSATSAMRALGLFSILPSFGLRALLALLGGCLALRLVDTVEQLQRGQQTTDPQSEQQEEAKESRTPSQSPLHQIDRWPWGELFPLLVYAGAVMLLIGLLVNNLWGWQTESLTLRSGEQVQLRGTAQVTLDEDAHRVTHSPGLVAYIEERGPGVVIDAVDGDGAPLPLQQTVGSEPVTELSIALTTDQYFAILEKQMIVRLTPRPNSAIDAGSPVLVQVYRSPPGRLMTEKTMSTENTTVTVDDTTLEISRLPYARLTVTFSPGLWPMSAGLLLSTIGLLGSVVWSQRHLWSQVDDDDLEETDDSAPGPAGDEEG